MGPAILNGGITTVLALFFLAFSQSYAFIVFFKVSKLAERETTQKLAPKSRLFRDFYGEFPAAV